MTGEARHERASAKNPFRPGRCLPEELIRAGRVTVNGIPAVLGTAADPETDAIKIDGRPLPGPQKNVYILLHKPRGYVTTLSDEKGRKNVTQLVTGCGCRGYPGGCCC